MGYHAQSDRYQHILAVAPGVRKAFTDTYRARSISYISHGKVISRHYEVLSTELRQIQVLLSAKKITCTLITNTCRCWDFNL